MGTMGSGLLERARKGLAGRKQRIEDALDSTTKPYSAEKDKETPKPKKPKTTNNGY